MSPFMHEESGSAKHMLLVLWLLNLGKLAVFPT